jgi:putative hydrolase of the HAD superfamily
VDAGKDHPAEAPAARPAVPIRCVVFDIDDTLVPWQTVAHWQWAWRPQGPVLNPRRVQSILRRAVRQWDRRRWKVVTGAAPPIDLDQYRAHLRETLNEIAGHPLPPPEVEAVIDRFLHPTGGLEPFPDVLPGLAVLSQRGLLTCGATDLPRPVMDWALRRVGVPAELLRYSGDDPERLPARAAFRRLVTVVGTKPAETLYVGDLFWSDVRAAARAGLSSVLLDRWNGLDRVASSRIASLAELPAYLDGLGQRGPEPDATEPVPLDGPD